MIRLHKAQSLPPLVALRRTGWRFDLVVEGHSMEPVLRAGDKVTVACVPPEECRPGDLICFKEGDGFILHRLLARRASDRWLFEKGDAEVGGRWMNEDRLLGRAEQINGAPVDFACRKRALYISRMEAVVSKALRKTGLAPLLAGLKTQWRKLKRKGLEAL